jgi:hypothetical protein
LAVISFWVRPFMRVGKREVVIESAFGVIKRRFPYDKLRIEEGGRLVAEKGADWKYLPVPRWVCHPDDWAQLVQRYGEL